jgi:hypothetical protein
MLPFGLAECHERLYGENLYISLQKNVFASRDGNCQLSVPANSR